MKGKSTLLVTLRGGLGNQLFSYALGLELSRLNGLELVLDSSLLPSSQDSLGGVSRFPSEIQNFLHEGKVKNTRSQPLQRTNMRSKAVTALTRLFQASPELSAKIGVVLTSNLATFLENPRVQASWIPDLIIRGESALKFRSDIQLQVSSLRRPSLEYLRLSDEIRRSAPVAVHLREGDYQNLRHLYGPSSPSEYLHDAISRISPPGGAELWIFSDSPYATQRMDLNGAATRAITSETLSSPLETLLLMSQAIGLVGANSTFSWWAAFLARDGFSATLPFFAEAKHNISRLSTPSANTSVIAA